MAVTEIKTFVRPNTSVEFNPTLSDEVLTLIQQIESPFISNSSLTITFTISSDELTATATLVYSNIEIFNAYNKIVDTTLLGNGAPLGLTVYNSRNQHMHDNKLTFTITRNFNT
jgi:hypothetical protein